MKALTGFLIALAGLGLARCVPGPADASVSREPWPCHDHHVHVLSPALIDMWKDMGIPFSRPDADYADIDTILSRDACRSVSLISMAYVYSSAEFGGGPADADSLIRLENDYLASLKRRHPERIRAFFGIDPLHADAQAEWVRCHQELSLDGMKLHFNASQVDLRRTDHLVRVREAFAYAADYRLPVILHIDNTETEPGGEAFRLLADSVLAPLAYADLQIAHLGTSGGWNDRTREMLDMYLQLVGEAHPAFRHRVYFDLSAVCLDKDSEGVHKLRPDQWPEVVRYVRRLGLDRIRFGTDYPLYTAGRYREVLRDRLGLSDVEITQLLSTR